VLSVFEANARWGQASLIGYEQIRQIEEAEQLAAMQGAKM